MKNIITIWLLILFGCSPRYSIYEIPMYGNLPKSELQRKDDSLFIIEETQKYNGNNNASTFYSKTGWKYMQSGRNSSSPPLNIYHETASLKTAMRVFNRAWLLDSTNANSYWGMATIVGYRDKKYEFAQELMAKAIRYDSTNYEIWFDYGVSNMEIVQKAKIEDKTKLLKYRDEAIMAFQKVTASNTDNQRKEMAKKYIGEMQLIK
jgi:tetratricopeptide (TPR) repeat protein